MECGGLPAPRFFVKRAIGALRCRATKREQAPALPNLVKDHGFHRFTVKPEMNEAKDNPRKALVCSRWPWPLAPRCSSGPSSPSIM